MHLPRAGLSLLKLMPTLKDIATLLRYDTIEERETIKFLSFAKDDGFKIRNWLVLRPTPRYDFSGTINIPLSEKIFPSLIVVANELQEFFGAPTNLQLFYSVKHSGLPPHTDVNDSLILQIFGRKRWTVADVCKDSDMKDGNAGAVLPPQASSVILEPGDVLYKPSNAIHSTENLTSPNLALTASIQTRTARDVLLEHLKISLSGDPVWMERLPLLVGDQRRKEVLELITEACKKLGKKLPTGKHLEQWWKI